MRKAAIALIAALGLMAVAAGSAVAKPTIKFKATAVPIPGFSHTGNIYGAGAAVSAEYSIIGKEYYGGPQPLKHVNFYLPAGAKIHPAGFTTCKTETLTKYFAPEKCPKASKAYAGAGSVTGRATLAHNCKEAYEAGKLTKEQFEQCEAEVEEEINGTKPEGSKIIKPGFEVVNETASITPWFVPGGLVFFTKGTKPVLLQVPSKGNYTNINGTGGKGPTFHAEVPKEALETVPGAPLATVQSIKVRAGTGRRVGRKVYYYGTMPTKCKHFLPIKTEVTFFEVEGELGEILKESHVTAEYHAPCPKRR